MAIDDVYKAVFTGTYFGQTCQNVFFFSQENAGGGLTDLAELASMMKTAWVDFLKDYQTTAFMWDSLVITNWYTGLEEVTLPIAVSGTLVSDGLPAWFVYNLSWNRVGSGYNYPSKRVSGVAESKIYNGEINVVDRAAMVTALDDMIEFITGSGVRYGYRVFSPSPGLGQNPYVPPFKAQAPTAGRDAILGTQKTRK